MLLELKGLVMIPSNPKKENKDQEEVGHLLSRWSLLEVRFLLPGGRPHQWVQYVLGQQRSSSVKPLPLSELMRSDLKGGVTPPGVLQCLGPLGG